MQTGYPQVFDRIDLSTQYIITKDKEIVLQKLKKDHIICCDTRWFVRQTILKQFIEYKKHEFRLKIEQNELFLKDVARV